MIKILDNNHHTISKKIHYIFQRSYAVEAEILKCDDFPPLNRSSDEIKRSKSEFYGYFKQSNLAAVLELEKAIDHVHIRSLTVDPESFRQGIGFKLLGFVEEEYGNRRITVETGNENQPAVDFYLKFGFEKDRVWMTEIGIVKASFTLQKNK